ncbi:alkyl/aryl-sulfatase [Youngiibacter multivorans]|uniref:Alkyl sulfatase BDS1-like metallo-beta-lactamase superfamily hydrolase n=1 Tax=Youngiibacter multivorans TaxID=937251 RepID=A0ABS4G5N4_9CLOT|nr:alkyl/aryl-sulfatase [Youngiibacter multivorans]MBP1919870.1 alkyl sulfatase BDS1-like metallo-beta-lactamase superfamily hydrolase [Youngiibacter multivorans]
MLGEQRLISFTEENYRKTITKVNDRIYHFLGFSHSNAVAIFGDTSVILVDTLDSDECAEDLKAELLKITDKPVKTIIYTHGHPDHRGGAGAFRDTAEEIIAFLPQKPILKYYERLNDVLAKRGTYQHGYGLTDEEAICQGIGIREGKEIGKGKYDFINPTTTYNEKTIERVIDGVKIRLVSAVGESDDQVYIWLEDDRVICTGDNYYGCWPNLYAIRGTQYRDIAAWIDSLNEILSYEASALLPGHTKPLIGYDQIQNHVGTFRDAIEYVLFQTLDCMNRGMTMSEAVENVKLPSTYTEKDYLGEYYGTVEWAVKSVYTGYLGWFDGNPVKLMPVSDREFNKALLDLIGVEKLLEKIKGCMEKEEYQLALQLLELTENNDLKKEALLMRAKQMTSANARHYLIASAKEF